MNGRSRRTVRRAHGAGMWFPDDPDELRQMVNEFMDKAEVPAMTRPIAAAISPHAGYVYSGPVAGHTFRALRESAACVGLPETVVVLGFGHRAAFHGVAIMDGDAIETPLGEATLDADGAHAMIHGRPRLFFDSTPHAGEHSAENQVPFLQAALPGTRLILGLIGDHDPHTVAELVDAVSDLADRRRTLVVASSDMLHDPDYALVRHTDERTLKRVESMDHAGLLNEWSLRRQIFCGIAPVIAAMQFAERQGCVRGRVLHYRNSGDDFPESRGHWVVGYGAVVFEAATS